MGNKKCIDCGQVKSLSDFPTHRIAKSGFERRCYDCKYNRAEKRKKRDKEAQLRLSEQQRTKEQLKRIKSFKEVKNSLGSDEFLHWKDAVKLVRKELGRKIIGAKKGRKIIEGWHGSGYIEATINFKEGKKYGKCRLLYSKNSLLKFFKSKPFERFARKQGVDLNKKEEIFMDKSPKKEKNYDKILKPKNLYGTLEIIEKRSNGTTTKFTYTGPNADEIMKSKVQIK